MTPLFFIQHNKARLRKRLLQKVDNKKMINIAASRLYFQRVSSSRLSNPLEVVKWLGAIQAQDYSSALWSIGLRLSNSTMASIEESLKQKQIIRVWSLRGTLHLLPAEDVRWMLSIVVPAFKARFAREFQQLGLDDAAFAKIFQATEKVLQGKQLSRKEFLTALAAEGVNVEGRMGGLIMYRVALEGFLCVAESGKQDSYGLLAECAPQQKLLSREESLAEAAKRYFMSHAPATIQDFAWWLGITIGEAKIAFDAVKSFFQCETVDKKVYWMPQESSVLPDSSKLFLHSGFDEIFLGYKDRRLIVDKEREQSIFQGNGVYRWTMIQNGVVIGTWKRTIRKNQILIEAEPFRPLSNQEIEDFQAAAKCYADYLGLELG
jgi:hypothetical protein